MKTTDYATAIVNELLRTTNALSNREADALVDAILQAKKIFVAGAGRSGLMARAFVMRLMHMGLQAYVIGETVTPSFNQGDLLIIGSGSGETKSLVSMAEKAKQLTGTVALVTISPRSTIGQQADLAITLPAKAKNEADDAGKSIQPMGSLFEQSLLVFYDAIILSVMDRLGLDSAAMYGQHANLE